MQGCTSMTCSDISTESRSCWQPLNRRGQVNATAYFCQKEGFWNCSLGANWICFPCLFCIFPFLCLVVPSHSPALSCWNNIGVWMLEGSSGSGAQMSQLFHCKAQMVPSGSLKPDKVQRHLWRAGSTQQAAHIAAPQ